MTYDLIEINAYDEARRAFISLMLAGSSLDHASGKRAEIFEQSRVSRCSKCLMEKHVSKFYKNGNTATQTYCIDCMKEYVRVRGITDYNEWRSIRHEALA